MSPTTETPRAADRLARLRSIDPAQPVPSGRLEFWPPTQLWGMRIMRVIEAGTLTPSEADVRQIWPPLADEPGDSA